eukprot:TRINITY_DN10934_c0_g1_i3.p1 TRINITY_DN10934_c0_g1~~TRINITY_DN10934_c0_g1_i3.p1  ORF type:complete len:107 (-),score=5.52 TRINITY_DN10934_c0_g1_i3:1772-2092(-)
MTYQIVVGSRLGWDKRTRKHEPIVHENTSLWPPQIFPSTRLSLGASKFSLSHTNHTEIKNLLLGRQEFCFYPCRVFCFVDWSTDLILDMKAPAWISNFQVAIAQAM